LCPLRSDGLELTIDAQPDFNPGWSDGTLCSLNGFTSISVYSTAAVESLFGVGGQNGGRRAGWFLCSVCVEHHQG
jgi:hypothetical protein